MNSCQTEAATNLLKALFEPLPGYPGDWVYRERIIATQAHRLREVMGYSITDLHTKVIEARGQ